MSADQERRTWLLERGAQTLSAEDLRHISDCYYGDPSLLTLFDLPQSIFFQKNMRILGRTAIECCIDHQARQIAESAKKVWSDLFGGKPGVILDLFMGSGNLMHHIARSLPWKKVMGFEKHETIYNYSLENFNRLNLPYETYLGSFQESLKTISLLPTDPLFVIVAPPWSDAFNHKTGLNLLKTNPPVPDILKCVRSFFRSHDILFMIQTHELVEPTAIHFFQDHFSFTQDIVFSGLKDGLNVGVLFCYNERSENVLQA